MLLSCLSFLLLLAHEYKCAMVFLQHEKVSLDFVFLSQILENLVLFFHQVICGITIHSSRKLISKSLKLLHVIFLESYITVNSHSPKSLHAFFLGSLTRFWLFSKENNHFTEHMDCVSDLLCFIMDDPDIYLKQMAECFIDQ